MAASTHVSHDTHSTTAGGAWSTRRIATTALFCALAFVLTFVEIPIFPPAPWLMYDPSGIVAFVAALAFGPSTGAIVVILPWVLKTLFTFDVWGHVMAIVAGVALCVPAALIGGGGILPAAAGGQGQRHGQRQDQSQHSFHFVSSCSFLFLQSRFGKGDLFCYSLTAPLDSPEIK